MNIFGKLRIINGFKSQAVLAKHLGVNQTAVSQWERGITTPSPSILKTLSHLYGVSIDMLLDNNQYGNMNSLQTIELVELFSKLSPEKQNFFLAAMRGMIKEE